MKLLARSLPGLLVLAVACTASDPENAPAEAGARPASATPATRDISVGDGRVRLSVPLDWSDAPKRERDSFAWSASVLHRPSAHAFEMVCPPEGCEAGILIGIDETYEAPGAFYGWTIEEIATWSKSAPNGRGHVPTQASASRRGTGMEVLQRYGAHSSVRQRLWSHDGTLSKATCFCRGSGCKIFESCVLGDPPSDAGSTKDPLFGAATPIRLSLPGIGHVDASPALVPASEQQLESLRPTENSMPLDQEVGLVSMVSDRVDGMVALSYSARPMGSACGAKARAEFLRDLLKGALTTRQADDGERYVVSYGDLESWARRVVWCDDGKLHTASCDCAGSPCALARRTCTLSAED